MKQTIPLILITALVVACAVPKPRALTADQRLQAAQAQLVFIQASAQFQAARTGLESAEKNYRAVLDQLRSAAGVASNCELNDKQEWQCPTNLKEKK